MGDGSVLKIIIDGAGAIEWAVEMRRRCRQDEWPLWAAVGRSVLPMADCCEGAECRECFISRDWLFVVVSCEVLASRRGRQQ